MCRTPYTLNRGCQAAGISGFGIVATSEVIMVASFVWGLGFRAT